MTNRAAEGTSLSASGARLLPVPRSPDGARQRTVQGAGAHGCRFVNPPAGLFGWVDTGTDTEALAQAMHDDGWLLAPGHLFHARRQPTTLMRINCATSQDAGFWRAYAKLRRGR